MLRAWLWWNDGLMGDVSQMKGVSVDLANLNVVAQDRAHMGRIRSRDPRTWHSNHGRPGFSNGHRRTDPWVAELDG